MLKEQILAEYELSQNQLARPLAFRQIALPKSSALRLGLFLIAQNSGITLQSHYDLKMARSERSRAISNA
jgi:plasmid maintenance system antidote protein VapI